MSHVDISSKSVENLYGPPSEGDTLHVIPAPNPMLATKISHPVWPVHLKPLSNLIHADSRIVNQHTFGSYHYVCWLNTFRKHMKASLRCSKSSFCSTTNCQLLEYPGEIQKKCWFSLNHIEEHPYYSTLFHTIPYYSILFHRSKINFPFLTGSSHISISIPSKINLKGIPHLTIWLGHWVIPRRIQHLCHDLSTWPEGAKDPGVHGGTWGQCAIGLDGWEFTTSITRVYGNYALVVSFWGFTNQIFEVGKKLVYL